MNKKVILGLLVAIVILVPVVIFASNKLGTPIYIAPSDKEVEHILLERKQKFLNDVENGRIDTPEVYSSMSLSEIEENEKIKAETQKEEDAITSIINKFYPNELKLILQKIDNENIIYYNSASETQKELYKLVLNVLEEKDLTQEESNILKEFLDSAYSNIKGDIELRARFDAIL
ncbi:MAG: hypothetical protein HFJ26_01595 [Clostridia bacterium]|nr:hypothetical protein [Clostridia bacterium]